MVWGDGEWFEEDLGSFLGVQDGFGGFRMGFRG